MKVGAKVALLSLLGFGAGFGAISFFSALSGKQGNKELDELLESQKDKLKIDWALLRRLDLKTGEADGELRKIDGRVVEMPGFMVPLEDDSKQVSEFLLVPSPQACIHVPPPPANQMIHVKMAPGIKTAMAFGPIWLVGKMQIRDYAGPYGTSSFFVTGISTRPYD